MREKRKKTMQLDKKLCTVYKKEQVYYILSVLVKEGRSRNGGFYTKLKILYEEESVCTTKDYSAEKVF